MTVRLCCLVCRCLEMGHSCLYVSRRGNGNHYKFGSWCVAALCHAVDRHQNIGFGKIGCSAVARNLERRDEKVFGYSFSSFEVTGKIDQLTCFEPGFSQILWI